ncbi:hypothetical protein FF38_03619 [Lucilia cuprina]|uniref:Uncharacterized protein n=1 Tax=Lucilia cuprina TaxID=7375 RepID=A0A0L0CQC4_LUCCU|nr:hypothetical protein CVS40_0615 [Lucilia cuprina]KNC34446.1 hypothetical protein FF38_03619 [Lucilia cuprina]
METTKIFALVLLISFIQIIPVYSDSQRLLETWNKINTNNVNDIQKSNDILKEIKEEQFALSQLRAIVERHLRTKNSEQVVNALSTNDISISDKKLREIVANISMNYDMQMIDSIIAQTIDELLLTRNLTEMPDLLWSVYQEKDLKHFEIMLRLQIRLYSSYSVRHHPDEDEFLQKYAYRLHKIKNETLYTSANVSLKSNVNSIAEKLPNNLKYLYFEPYFCLLNVKFQKYIYTAIELKVDPKSRYIWLWYDNKSMDDTGYVKAEVSNNSTKFQVALKGTKYQLYYYMMPDTHTIAGWDTDGVPSNYTWDLEFVDNDRVVFSQNDYLMCGVEPYDNERRNVGGRKKGEVSSTSPECQWRLGECLFE